LLPPPLTIFFSTLALGVVLMALGFGVALMAFRELGLAGALGF